MSTLFLPLQSTSGALVCKRGEEKLNADLLAIISPERTTQDQHALNHLGA